MIFRPDAIHPLIGSLRPPAGYQLDQAVGTTFSLKLDALLLPPAAFALFEASLGTTGDEDATQTPVGLLESVRRHAGRILMFCQNGQIAVPEKRKLVPFLERCVVPVDAPRGGLFHPKVWVLRFRHARSVDLRYRLLVMTRNLTFDSSWDTVARLDSSDDGVDLGGELAQFIDSLPGLAHDPMRADRRQVVADLAKQLETVRFALPNGFHHGRFLGLPRQLPFPANAGRMLVISPYLGSGLLSRLPKRSQRSVMVSRPEAIDDSADDLDGFETFILSPDLASSTDDGPSRPIGDPALTESGLHAKAFLFDVGETAHLFTGSANATQAAFSTNVEVMLELHGQVSEIGVEATLAQSPDGQPSFSDLLQPYRADPRRLEESGRLDGLRRRLASFHFRGEVRAGDDDGFLMHCTTAEPLGGLPPEVHVRIWPLTAEAAGVSWEDGPFDATFRFAKASEVTSFWVVELTEAEESTHTVVTASLSGDPPNRLGLLIVDLLRDKDRLLRYLLLLLAGSDADPFDLTDVTEGTGGTTFRWGTGSGDLPLLETMLRALVDEPERLRHVHDLLQDLEAVEEGRDLVPDGLRDVFRPIWQVAEERQ